MLAVTAFPHGLTATLASGVTLSQELPTFGLLRKQVLVGYRWQNIGLNPDCSGSTATLSDFVSQPSDPVRAAYHGIRLSTSPEYLLLSSRDSISTSHFPLRCSSDSASTLPPRQVGFQGRCRLLSLCRYHRRLTTRWSANAITASR